MKIEVFIHKWKNWTQPEDNLKKYGFRLALTAVLCFFICAFTWYPGVIADDTMNQYLQAIGEAPISDWHPPLFVWFWRLEIKLFHTANLLNATWIFLNILGLYLFFRLRPCKLSLIFFALIFAFPSFFGINGYLYKDIPLAWLLLISVALLFTLDTKKKYYYPKKILISLILLLCCLIRVNAAFIVAPLLLSTWWEWRFDIKHLTACLLLALLALPVSGWINHYFLKAASDHAEASLQIFDLAGISFYSKYKNYDFYDESNPERHEEIFNHWSSSPINERLLTCYTPKKWDVFGAWGLKKFPSNKLLGWNKWGDGWNAYTFSNDFKSKAQYCLNLGQNLRTLPPKDLSKMWIKAIETHPLAYFKHRFAYFSNALYFCHMDEVAPDDVDIPSSTGYFPFGKADAVYGTPERRTFLAHLYRNLGKHHRSLWVNYGFFWIISALALFIASLKGKGKANQLINLSAFSAFCYLLAYFFIGVGIEWRYILPSISLLLAACLIWYVSEDHLGTKKSQKIALAVWGIFMFWSCIL